MPTKTFVKAGTTANPDSGGNSSVYDPANSAMKLHQLAMHNHVVEVYEKVCCGIFIRVISRTLVTGGPQWGEILKTQSNLEYRP